MKIFQENFIKENTGKLTLHDLAESLGVSKSTVHSAQKRLGLKNRRKEAAFDTFVPQRKQMRVVDVMKLMCQKPKTMETLARESGISERTAYRYMALMVDIGADVKMTADNKYFLDECPFCKKKL
jgi:predicted DNA-binding transcriptional regulator YafY